MPKHPPRIATIVLVEPDGRVIGRLRSESIGTRSGGRRSRAPTRPAPLGSWRRSRPRGRPSSYRRFLDRIEPSEWPYHERDPADWLGRTVAPLAASNAATD
jgi:hypothetical protein